jgi:hypothetical protein
MKVGAEPKKVAILGVLGVVLAYFVYSNLASDDIPAPSGTPAASGSRAAAVDSELSQPQAAEVRPRPPLRPGRQSQLRLAFSNRQVDPTSVDPTLRLDLLAKVQAVTLQGGERNLFQFGAAPMPKTPEPKVIPKPVEAQPAAEAKPAEPVKPPPPPIPLKFYGYTSQPREGQKKAFFLDGEEIVVAGEGEVVRKRYKVVRIGINSVVVEDTEHKHQQTLPLEEPQAG